VAKVQHHADLTMLARLSQSWRRRSSCRHAFVEHGPIGACATAARRHSFTEARNHLRYRSRDERVALNTIVYEQGEERWVVASIPEVSGAHSQGRTREEARANVIDALRGILELRFGGHPEVSEGTDSEPLELVIGA